MTKSGLYIVIEGHDGTGKSTQVRLLCRRLKKELGVNAIEFHEPAGTPISNELKTIIKDGKLERTPKTDLLLFSAARCEIWQKKALPALNSGQYVIASRNWWSTLVYQGYGDGLDSELITQITATATDKRYLSPNIKIILSLDNEKERLKRLNGRKLKTPDAFESKNKEFQKRVQNGYLEIAHQQNVTIIDAAQTIDEIAKEIWQIVQAKINND